MHWIVQNNLINPQTRDMLLGLLGKRSTPYSLVELVPIFGMLTGPAPVVQGPVYVYGSTSLGPVARENRWVPGYFEDNLDYERMLEQYGDLALNAGAICATLETLSEPSWERFFIRPVHDNKSFAGTVMTWAAFDKFRQGVQSVADEPDATVRVTDRIVVAPLIELAAEFRFFVIKGRVVTGSRYKLGDRVESSTDVPAHVWAFAQSCSERWAPNAAFAIDIAVTATGLKVIELNSANSAGFYACDVGRIVDAVNEGLC